MLTKIYQHNDAILSMDPVTALKESEKLEIFMKRLIDGLINHYEVSKILALL